MKSRRQRKMTPLPAVTIDPSTSAATTAIAVLSTSDVEGLVERVVARLLAARAETPEYLDAERAAALLGVSRRSLPQLVRRDGLPVHRVGRLYRFRRDEVIAWLERRAEEPGAHASRHRRRLVSIR